MLFALKGRKNSSLFDLDIIFNAYNPISATICTIPHPLRLIQLAAFEAGDSDAAQDTFQSLRILMLP